MHVWLTLQHHGMLDRVRVVIWELRNLLDNALKACSRSSSLARTVPRQTLLPRATCINPHARNSYTCGLGGGKMRPEDLGWIRGMHVVDLVRHLSLARLVNVLHFCCA